MDFILHVFYCSTTFLSLLTHIHTYIYIYMYIHTYMLNSEVNLLHVLVLLDYFDGCCLSLHIPLKFAFVLALL